MKLIPKHQTGKDILPIDWQPRSELDPKYNLGSKSYNQTGQVSINPNDMIATYNGIPYNRTGLAENNYVYSKNGENYALQPLNEVEVTAKRETPKHSPFYKFINDEIMMNPNGVRTRNMQKLMSTDSGRKIQKSFQDGGRDAAIILSSPLTANYAVEYIPELANLVINNGKGLISDLKYRPIPTIARFGNDAILGWIGGKTVDNTTKAITGLNWNDTMNKYGIMPKNWGNYLNPGYFGGSYVNEWLFDKPGRRLIETFMRTSDSANIFDNFREVNRSFFKPIAISFTPNIPKEKRIEMLKRPAAIIKYIALGKRTPGIYYNTFSYINAPYNGIYGLSPYYDRMFSQNGYKNGDLIDAFLYKKPMKIEGLEKDPLNDKGVFDSYVAEKYPNKEIPTYQVTSKNATWDDTNIPQHPNQQSIQPLIGATPEGDMRSIQIRPGLDINTAGHLKVKGTNNTFQQQDIWKFNADEYMKRWGNAYMQQTPFKWNKKNSFKNNIISFNNSKVKPLLTRKLANTALQTVDYYGTPVITKSPWFITPFGGN